MHSYIYETHVFPDPLLPFIFHRQFVITKELRHLNWHENIELLYCTEGSGHVRCGAQSVPFAAGDIFVVNADLPHSITSSTQIRYRCLIIDDSFFLQNGIPVSTVRFRGLIRDEYLQKLFEEVTAAYSLTEKSLTRTANIRCAVLGVICYLCAHYTADASHREDFSDHVKKALAYIRSNYTAQLTLDQIAGQVGISKYHLCREFKTFTGSSIVQTVNLLRCAQAKHMIESGKSVSTAAICCGFENLSYFSRAFKKLIGVLPSQLERTQ